jgi:hypothetical protein
MDYLGLGNDQFPIQAHHWEYAQCSANEFMGHECFHQVLFPIDPNLWEGRRAPISNPITDRDLTLRSSISPFFSSLHTETSQYASIQGVQAGL